MFFEQKHPSNKASSASTCVRSRLKLRSVCLPTGEYCPEITSMGFPGSHGSDDPGSTSPEHEIKTAAGGKSRSPSLPKPSSHTLGLEMFGPCKGLLRRCLGVQTPTHWVFGILGQGDKSLANSPGSQQRPLKQFRSRYLTIPVTHEGLVQDSRSSKWNNTGGDCYWVGG